MNEKRKSRKYIVWLIFAIIVIALYKTTDGVYVILEWLKNTLKIFAPFGFAVLLAYVLYFPCRKIEKFIKKAKWKWISKKARGIAIAIIYILLILGILLLFKVIFPLLSESIIDLAKSLPNYYNKAIEMLEKQPEDSLWTKIDAISYVKKIENLPDMIINFLEFDNISKYIKTITSFAGIIFDVFITFIVSFYILSERSDIKNFLKHLSSAVLSEKGYNKISRYYGKINNIFYKFITAQLLDAVIIGIITTIAMLIMNVKYARLLGFLIGLFNVIPYFGAIIAVGFAVLLTIFTGGFAKALWLALVIIILQQIDANIINPKILGDSLEISRILIVFSVTVFGAWFGVIGMFLAVPMIGLIKVLVLDFIEEKEMEKELERVRKIDDNII